VKYTNFLQELLETYTPSGYERLGKIYNIRQNYLFAFKHYNDSIGNLYFERGSEKENALKVFISAHYDENALQIVNITDTGFLNVINLGGPDRKTIEGSHVFVISDEWDKDDVTQKKLIPGIIGKKPVHKESKDEKEKVDEYDKMLVDIGASSKDEVKELGIHIGSVIVFKKDVDISFGPKEDKIVSNGLDDKIGIYAVTAAFLDLDEQVLINKNIKVILGWLSQEEVGLRGATVAAQYIQPDISVDVDVTFDTGKGTFVSKDKFGNVEMGKGVVIDYGPHSNYTLINDLKDIANKFALSYQEQVSKVGANNCSALQVNAKDCATAHLGIPIRNMHTQVEIVQKDDVDNCVDLIKLYIENI